MNSSMTYSITEISSSVFGTNQHMIWMWLVLAIVIAANLFTYFYLGNIYLSGMVTLGILGFSVILGIIPIWLVGIYGLTFVYLLFFYTTNAYNTTEPSTTDTDAWAEYGNKIKLAYTAKFGGENAGFNDEVDKRILVMQNNRRGFTHTIARDWLRRMSNFTESK